MAGFSQKIVGLSALNNGSIVFRSVAAVFAFLYLNCISSDERIFMDLRSTLSKSHPRDSASVQLCIETGDTVCLHEVRRTMAAVDMLLKNGKDSGLRKTLTAIRCNCRKNRNMARQKDLCHGTLAALFLFDSEKEDSVVMSFLQDQEIETVSNIFLHYETCWLRNRKNIDKWILFIDTMKNISSEAKIRALKTVATGLTVNNDCPLQIIKMPLLKFFLKHMKS